MEPATIADPAINDEPCDPRDMKIHLLNEALERALDELDLEFDLAA